MTKLVKAINGKMVIKQEQENETKVTIKRQTHKMVKQTHTIRRQPPTNCLSVFDHFARLVVKGLNKKQANKLANKRI